MLNRRLFILGIGSTAFLPIALRAQSCDQLGTYEGILTFEPQADGRYMRIARPYSYIDNCGVNWNVPEGAIVDGASIPRPLWSIVGAPLTGVYRDASVIHDWYCAVRTRTHLATHKMFYEAMTISGVSERQAKLMYLAVRKFGPKWDDLTIANNKINSREGNERITELTPDGLRATARSDNKALGNSAENLRMQSEYLNYAETVTANNLNISEIDDLVDGGAL